LIYLDCCALLKLVLSEPETPELRAFLSSRAREGHVTSALAQTEVSRALIRAQAEPEVGDAAEDLLDGDSKDRALGAFTFPSTAWTAFVSLIVRG
jgi:uncharacterized protein